MKRIRVEGQLTQMQKEVIKSAAKYLNIPVGRFIVSCALDKAYEILNSEEFKNKEYYNEE